MEIKSIDDAAYAAMRYHFEKFVREMKELVGEDGAGKEWLDNQQVCSLLKISSRTLQYYRDCGKLPFSRIGNKCYYKSSDIEKLIANSLNSNT